MKVGGSVLAYVELLDAALEVIRSAAASRRLLVVPGGGPFADTVREVHRRVGLSETAAHWMAVLAMDQYAHLIAGRLPGATIVAGPSEIGAALAARRVPVLAPSPWLRESDPLPHSWDVTSDSIAAWISGRVGARRLVLVKPPGLRLSDAAVDAYFQRALPEGITAESVAADQIDALRAALRSQNAERQDRSDRPA